MAQGFDGTKPVYQSFLSSQEVRLNFCALDTQHSGGVQPGAPSEGRLWFDTIHRCFKRYYSSAWRVEVQYDLSGNIIIDCGTF